MNEENVCYNAQEKPIISGCTPAVKLSLGPFVNAEKLILTAKPGDLIEMDRLIYAHWAIYFGKGEVVQVSCEDLDEYETQAIVEKVKLTEVAGDSLVRINNKQVPAKKLGVTPLKMKKIVQNLTKLIGQKVTYNIVTKNTEHFVTEWKFGVSWSDQANSSLQSMKLLSSSPKTVKDLQVAHTAITRNIKTLLQRQISPTRV